VSKMRKGKKALPCLLAVALSGSALAEGSPPMPTIDLSPKTTCIAEPREWQGFDKLKQPSCLGLDLGYSIGRKTSLQVGAGVQLTGLGVRYRFDEFRFTEVRVGRRLDSFTLTFVWQVL
jgi:hypothetical protein